MLYSIPYFTSLGNGVVLLAVSRFSNAFVLGWPIIRYRSPASSAAALCDIPAIKSHNGPHCEIPCGDNSHQHVLGLDWGTRRVEDGFTGSQYSIRPMIWLCLLRLLNLKTAFLL